MTTSVLATRSYWREILERAGRQAAQTALPIVAAVTAAGHGLDYAAAALAIAGAVVVTILKALIVIGTSTDEPIYWQLLDRAVPAAAGTALGFIPVDVANVLTVHWSAVAYAAGAAAVVSILALYVTPPSGATPQDPGPEIEND